ncbi:four helix bundle protein, partial [Patescibacteria group bacterium]|nr:four helix bundle protein [Patescibacteria group bacterium]
PQQLTRAWNDPKGFQSLAVWQNAALLRVLIRKFTAFLPASEFRRRTQLDDAARSVKRNIEEGFKRPTTSQYLEFIGFSQASLEEVGGDFRDCLADGMIKSVKGSSLLDIGIDLGIYKGKFKGDFKGELKENTIPYQPLSSLKVKGEPDSPGHPYCEPLKSLKSECLTYEMFLELINKTDWLLRKLVGLPC